MNGVEILTSAQVVTEWTFNWTAFWIVFGIIFCICLIMGIWDVVTDDCEWILIPFVSILGVIFGTMLGVGVGVLFETPTAYETQYKITISDEVSMAEFLEYYEVIDQDGKIFTVREKTNESN